MSENVQNMTPETAQANPVESPVPLTLKRAVQVLGLLLLVPSLPIIANLVCFFPLALLNSSGAEVFAYGVVSLTVALLTVGAGLAAFIHANNSLQNKPSKPLQLPATPLLLAGSFVLLLVLGLALNEDNYGAAIFLAPILVTCATLPPLWTVAWMIPQARPARVKGQAEVVSAVENVQGNAAQPSLSWRRGLLSFAGGATVGVSIAVVLEILLPVIILSLVFNLTEGLSVQMNALFRALSNAQVAEALTNPAFVFVFIQIALIAPLAEELAKPLVTLPLLRHLSKQEAFWVGALAGAGFAAVENVIYATSGLSIWAGILVVRALGGALHPLGSGLVAQGWWGVLRGEKAAGLNWLKRFGIATAVHAAWNGGSLLVITLGGARLFGELPPEIDLLGLSAAGTTLAFLVILGISALWIGRLVGHDRPMLGAQEEASPESGLVPSDRALALWAVVCLLAIVPAGIAGLKIWLR